MWDVESLIQRETNKKGRAESELETFVKKELVDITLFREDTK